MRVLFSHASRTESSDVSVEPMRKELNINVRGTIITVRPDVYIGIT